ncbi:type II secretion system F family protein [Microbacterium sp. ARD32]|uniref:type II secretion system F family protein n=1 Tax=Microbacterium sp. ARD32 TaxID=2962577 RepID=UPI002881B02E|nr:type II secretion system F family protein [Microbacterium sp. ARD32]MDT0158473.1 type II secretion system F family protein [Microbacterium sp. ARD32]
MVIRGLPGRGGAADAGDTAAAAASSVRTLAVLLQAGSRPVDAWRHLADTGDPVALRVVERCAAGADPACAIDAEGGTWSDVAAAWEIATIVGAPLADVLRSLAESLQDAAAAADDVRIALAEPTGTARLLLWLPFAGLLLGFALGFDTIGVLVANPLGIACVVAGVALVLAARLWTARLVRRAAASPGTPGMHAELVAVALSGGVGIPRALRLVEHSSAGLADDRTTTDSVLELSHSAGVPAGTLLRASAAQQRQEARVQGRIRAARLSSALLLPLGACTLPAFLLLGVAPLMLSVLSSTPLPI